MSVVPSLRTLNKIGGVARDEVLKDGLFQEHSDRMKCSNLEVTWRPFRGEKSGKVTSVLCLLHKYKTFGPAIPNKFPVIECIRNKIENADQNNVEIFLWLPLF